MDRADRKNLTCFFWKTATCKFKDSECKYMHRDTTHVAFDPKCNRKYVVAHPTVDNPKPKSNSAPSTDSANDDLISLCSYHESHEPERTSAIATQTESDSGPQSNGFTLEPVVIAIRENKDDDSIKELLATYSRSELRVNRNSYGTLFAAICANRPQLVTILCEHGTNANATGKDGIPILARAVLNPNIHATDLVRVLLSWKANPYAIPTYLWESSSGEQAEKSSKILELPIWLKEYSELLPKRLTVSMKYYLEQASKSGSPSSVFPRLEKQMFPPIVGQTHAVKSLMDFLLAHEVYKTYTSPIIALFGPPGSGKRTLAESIAMHYELSLTTGLENTYQGQEATENEGNPQKVVFIDGDLVDNAQLTAFLKNSDNDSCRPNQHTGVNAPTKAIIILSVTQSDSSLCRVCTAEEDIHKTEDDVQTKLRQELGRIYKPSVVDRIQHIVPFAPLRKVENAVLAHRSLLQALYGLFEDYKLRKGEVPKIELRASQEVFEYLGNPDGSGRGARHIDRRVTAKVILPIVKQYMAKFGNGDGTSLNGIITIKKTSKIENGSRESFLVVDVD